MKASTCPYCEPFRLVRAALQFACLECGKPMLLIDAPGVDHVYHCPDHCTTLAPNRDMIATARERH
jgi:hypothetical protein